MSMQSFGEFLSMGTYARGSPARGNQTPTSLTTHPMKHPCPQAVMYQSTCVYEVSMSFHSHGEPTPSTLVMRQPSPGISTSMSTRVHDL